MYQNPAKDRQKSWMMRRPINPVDQIFELAKIRDSYFRGVRFDEPFGDPGWFGPDSALWYVLSNWAVYFIGGYAGAFIQGCYPDTALAGPAQSRLFKRDENGQFTGEFNRDPVDLARHNGQTFSYFYGTAMANTQSAERLAKFVNGIHSKVNGVSPEGHTYDALSPEAAQWTAVSFYWGIGRAHERYAHRPLQGDDLDQFYRESARMYSALTNVGDTLPKTKAETEQYIEDHRYSMRIDTRIGVVQMRSLNPRNKPLPLRPAVALVEWATLDMMPSWMQEILRFRPPTRPGQHARRALLKTTLNGSVYSLGYLREYRDAMRRTTTLQA